MADYAVVNMFKPNHTVRVTIKRPTGNSTDMSAVYQVKMAVRTPEAVGIWEMVLISASASQVVADRYLTPADMKLAGEVTAIPNLYFPTGELQGDPIHFWVYD